MKTGFCGAGLPQPGIRDDYDKAVESRQSFVRAKKQIREVRKEQTARLFEAMCAGRRWGATTWREVLLSHPIMNQLCRRLVWRGETENGVLFLRPQGVSAAVDSSGSLIAIPEECSLVIAHDQNTPAEEAGRWLDHLAGYGIEPLFQQFNRGLPDLGPIGDEFSIEDYKGYLLTGFKLKSAATMWGYLRGMALDGPEFFYYAKRFPSLALEVHIEFTGNQIPEQNTLVALQKMTFWNTATRDVRGRSEARRVKLQGLPPVLLAESFHDLRRIAESGDGFDPGWREKISRVQP